MEKTLYLKRTSNEELAEQWGFWPNFPLFVELFIRCNHRGDVNWDVAPVYRSTELTDRKIKILS